MPTTIGFRYFFIVTLLLLVSPRAGTAAVILGDPPRAPGDVKGLPGGGPQPRGITGGFSVNTASREEVRSFYNAIFPSSDGVPMDTTADVSTCTAGTNSTAFQEAVLRRINWYRAMAGVPASVTLNNSNNTNDQQMAVMISANNTLSHTPPPSWTCFTGAGAHAASNSNIAIGSDGADSITGYIWDFGSNNYEVGHRRWLLYPQTQVMGTGDVPAVGGYNSANATWVFDANLFGPRPPTRQPYVAWPPTGYVPYQVVFPQWSLAVSNANLSAATVTMTSNGVAVAVSMQLYTTGYGENTLVWVPMGLDPTVDTTVFPFNGTDTVYSVTVNNIVMGASHFNISYNVTLFDPAVPGTDFVPQTITGPAQAVAGTGNAYSCRPANNPNVSSYQWRVSQLASGNFADYATNGMSNFTMSPVPDYPTITNAPVGSGNCFHLEHPDVSELVPQLLKINRVFLPAANSTFSFKSLLGYATTGEEARVQASTDGGLTWQDLYTQFGTGGSGESSFTPHTLSLANYAGRGTLLRFNYDTDGTSWWPYDSPQFGWCIESVAVSNIQQIMNSTISPTASTNFVFTPTQSGVFSLEAEALIFTQFPLGWGPVKQVTVASSVTMSRPVLTNNQVRLDFTVAPSGGLNTFKLLQASQVTGAWTTNTTATLTTNTPGSSYRFSTTNNAATRFYQVQAGP